MQVHTWVSTDDLPQIKGKDGAPSTDGNRALARIRCDMIGAGGKAVPGWAPILFTGTTEEEVRAKAETWWEAELEKWRRLAYVGQERARKLAAKGEAHLPAMPGHPKPEKGAAAAPVADDCEEGV